MAGFDRRDFLDAHERYLDLYFLRGRHEPNRD
jgi:hypothetical protein